MTNYEASPEGTFTKDQIREAVMTWHDGCAEGKAHFLRECLGINMDPVTVRVTVEVEIDRYDSDGDEMDAYEVTNRLQGVLDSNVSPSDFEVETLEFSVSG